MDSVALTVLRVAARKVLYADHCHLACSNDGMHANLTSPVALGVLIASSSLKKKALVCLPFAITVTLATCCQGLARGSWMTGGRRRRRCCGHCRCRCKLDGTRMMQKRLLPTAL